MAEKLSKPMSEQLRPSRMSDTAIGIDAKPTVAPKRSPMMSDAGGSVRLRQSKMSAAAAGLSVPLRESKLTGKTEVPPPPSRTDRRRTPLIESPSVEPSRMRERTPLIFGADPTQAIAAVRLDRDATEKSVEERRKSQGSRGGLTYSQLTEQKSSDENRLKRG